MTASHGADTCNLLKVPDGSQLLYHYTSAEAAVKGILGSGTLRLSPYAQMRDPLEYRELPRLLCYRDEGNHPDRLPIDEARDTLASLRNRMRILSLTSDATGYDDDVRAFGKGYARPRMWETYGRNHTGVCLAFDAAAMTNDEGDFRKNLRTKGAANLRPVEYTEGGFIRHPARVLPDITDDASGTEQMVRHLMAHHDAFWFLKLLDWETEYEYRFVHFPTAEESGPLDIQFGSALKAIVLGARFADSEIEEVMQRAETFAATVCQLRWDSGYPSVHGVGASNRLVA